MIFPTAGSQKCLVILHNPRYFIKYLDEGIQIKCQSSWLFFVPRTLQKVIEFLFLAGSYCLV